MSELPIVERLHEFWPDGFDVGDVYEICEEATNTIEMLHEARAEAIVDSHNNELGEPAIWFEKAKTALAKGRGE